MKKSESYNLPDKTNENILGKKSLVVLFIFGGLIAIIRVFKPITELIKNILVPVGRYMEVNADPEDESVSSSDIYTGEDNFEIGSSEEGDAGGE